MSEFAVTINLKTIVAYCGHVYAIPAWMSHYTCPICAADEIRDANKRREIAEHSASRLRGVITTLKRRTAKARP